MMTIMINNIIILALDKRFELWKNLAQECVNRGWKTKTFIVGNGTDKRFEYDHIDPQTPTPSSWLWGTGIGAERHWKAHLSHRQIIKYAIKKNMDSFLLLEDDAKFLPRFDSILDELEQQILTEELDLLYCGWHCWEYKDDKPIGKNLQVEEEYNQGRPPYLSDFPSIGGFHGVLINRSAYSKLLSLPITQPLDSMVNINKYAFRRAIVVPKVLDVQDCYSFCEDRYVSRTI